jgi:AraC-like DNA-binding protein
MQEIANWKKKIIEEFGLAFHVKDILVFEETNADKLHVIPFFADGYPGVMFQHTKKGVFLKPQNKYLSEIFLYGLAIHPIELLVEGTYRFIIFQLHPVAARALLGIDPKELNDDCYDLQLASSIDAKEYVNELRGTGDIIEQSEIIARMISQLILSKVYFPHATIMDAIEMIIKSKGKVSVKDLTGTLNITERTLQRNFVEHVGIPPKKFAKIMQFYSSFNQVTAESWSRLTDIVYENGFADQSHFIRDFKKFTGYKPNQLRIRKESTPGN